MTNEVIKAMRGKKKHKTREWWGKNGYQILRVILFPFWIYSLLLEKINAWLNNKESWNEERAAEILSYYIPRNAEWDAKDKSFYFFDNGMGWSLASAKRYLRRKDRRFWKVNSGWYGGEIRSFLMNKFELEGFTKELGDCSEGWTEISFTLNENIAD